MRRNIQFFLVPTFILSVLISWLTLAPSTQPTLQADPPKTAHQAYKEKLPDSDVTFEMLPIPGGVFTIGSPADEKGRNKDEGPQVSVTVKPFWMGKTEVTWDEYDAWWLKQAAAKIIAKDTSKDQSDAITSPTSPYSDETHGHGREGQAVLCMTHHSAMRYCEWLSEKTGKRYRLPTEVEWEYACRAGTKTAYSFGDDPAQLKDYGWIQSNSEELCHKVAQKKPNPWGLYDMHGNVAEWCLDHYVQDHYSKFPKEVNLSFIPAVLPTDKRFSHVARGGSWADKPEQCRSAARRGSNPNWQKRDPQRPQSIWWLTDADYVGFRIVRPIDDKNDYVNLKPLKAKVTRESNEY